VIQDLPDGALDKVKDFTALFPKQLADYERLLSDNPIWLERNKGIARMTAEQAIGLGVTGPMLRACGVAHDLRKVQPYSGYERYDFEVPTHDAGDCFARYVVRLAEMRESIKIIGQAVDRMPSGPVMVEDPKIAWPAQLALGADGLGNSPDYIRKIMGESMEALIHHFKLVTEGFKVPVGEVYVPIESPRGELGYHVVSTGGTKPWRVHVRDPSFVNLQSVPEIVTGGLVADVIAGIASVDPVMGGVDR
jgi:NADH-quinone oxidoreductase subunit D